MAGLVTDAHIVSAELSRLGNLDTNEYITAFGAHGELFYSTPNGYYTTHLPVQVVDDISAGDVKKIRRVSFGSKPDSWFISFELRDSTQSWRFGPGIPKVLSNLLMNRRITPLGAPKLRVQLNSGDSFVLWAWPMWVCYDLPKLLEQELQIMSYSYQCQGVLVTGYFSGDLGDTPENVTRHMDGSYYVHARDSHVWGFQPVMKLHWERLWQQCAYGKPELGEMAHVGINPHTSESFVFIKTHQTGAKASFIIHFGADDMHSRLPDLEPTPNCLEYLVQEEEKFVFYKSATSKRTGRPHPRDSWELELEKGEQVQFMREAGRDWYIARNQRGIRGWAHHSWLDFRGSKPYADPRYAYRRFESDMRKLLIPSQLCSFPSVSDYMDLCTESICAQLVQDTTLGMCIHNLQALLEGSERYSYEWLKEERNVWHPDKFARFCQSQHKERLKMTAQELFVMYGTLMDKCGAGNAGP